jgi:hypothetical protein
MRKPTLLKLRDPFARHIYLCPHACNGHPCEAVHIPYIKCNSTDDRKTWEMTVDIAIKYHRRVKIGPFCAIPQHPNQMGFTYNGSTVIDGTKP